MTKVTSVLRLHYKRTDYFLACSTISLILSKTGSKPVFSVLLIPVFRGLHHECLKAILRKS